MQLLFFKQVKYLNKSGPYPGFLFRGFFTQGFFFGGGGKGYIKKRIQNLFFVMFLRARQTFSFFLGGGGGSIPLSPPPWNGLETNIHYFMCRH